MWGYTTDETHDATLESFVDSANPAEAPFPVQNLPFGVFRRRGSGEPWRGGVAIGDAVLDLSAWAASGLVPEAVRPILADAAGPRLNPLLARPCEAWAALRLALSRALRRGAPEAAQAGALLVPAAEIEMTLPVDIGDYSDFLCSIHHASRCGRVLRGTGEVGLNYRHMPIGYHGRSSTVIPSGTPIPRPHGFWLAPGADAPVHAPSGKLDFELELAVLVGAGTDFGRPVPIGEAHRHLFGLVLMNDWSARDIQPFESVPLGPFLGKSWATTISTWIVTMAALAPFRAPLEPRPAGAPAPAPHLRDPQPDRAGLDLDLQVQLRSAGMRAAGASPQVLVRSHARHLYWSFEQMLTHQASNGCRLRPGDMLGSGTVSGPTDESAACLLELTEAGTRPFALGAESRSYLQDGDEVTLTAMARRPGARSIGFGPATGVILPAQD